MFCGLEIDRIDWPLPKFEIEDLIQESDYSDRTKRNELNSVI